MPFLNNKLFNFFRKNKRKHKRYIASDSACVVLGRRTLAGERLQIIDISLGGLAFFYEGGKADLEKLENLSLYSDDNLVIENMPFNPVKGFIPQDEVWFQRQGVQFKYMGRFDKKRLKEFIKRNSFEL